ncbi:MAG: FAD-binding oxidoreductase [Bacteroidales bacterium]|nr:FAD-binding oxidoreductase [Bacteroidales bacterium]MCF6341616.1 FAD-binding oxidoreductase [Bacteroidales bacterium]
MKTENLHLLLGIRNLTDSTYILEVERKGLDFEPGQHILMGRADSIHKREYSIYSGNNDKYLELLIKEVEEGLVSINLKKLSDGDQVEIEGPLGFFGLDEKAVEQKKKFLFVASGTGIAPFHSMVKSIPNLDYTLLHGVRYASEAYEKEAYDREKYILCTTGDKDGDFHGRVTDYIKQHQFDKDTICYFCGNFNMIKDAMDLLSKKGFPSGQLHAEVYF